MMMYAPDDTIVAIASPPGGAARGILRLSGRDVQRCVEAVFRADHATDLSQVCRPTVIPGTLDLTVRQIESDTLGGAAVAPVPTLATGPAPVPPQATSRLPCELYLWPGRHSYTGQPVAEVHTLGSPPLLEAALERFCAAGARLAEPGEFTLRAFLAGRIDLVQAEAVLGVIDAAGPADLDVALSQLAGGLAGPLHRLRDRLLDLLAHLEAGFDFADEDLVFIAPEELCGQLDAACEIVTDLARQMASRADVSELPRVVLAGSANVGKSSLFNALAGRCGALVSHLPGTTRDYLTAEVSFEGIRCLLIDTAGIGPEGQTPAEGPDRSAQTAASQQHRHATIQIFCLDSTRPMNAWEAEEMADTSKRRVVVLTKTDAAGQLPRAAQAIPTSSVTGEGIEALRAEVSRAVLAAMGIAVGAVAGTAVRCRESLRLAGESLRRARQLAQESSGEELVAAEVRTALQELGKVVGAVYTDDILDRVFSRFCVGK